MITQTIGNIALMFIALSLPWLAATGMTLLAKGVPARTDNSLATATISGEEWQETELHSSLFSDLQVAISE